MTCRGNGYITDKNRLAQTGKNGQETTGQTDDKTDRQTGGEIRRNMSILFFTVP